MIRLEEVILSEQPDLVIIRGDTNSTLAGAVCASKLHVPTAHIEAGERSYDRRMPEEINRLVADKLSGFFFCVSKTAVKRLESEGIADNVFWVGDVMLDSMMANKAIALSKSSVVSDLELTPGKYGLVTVHRAANTDNLSRLANIVAALNQAPEAIVFPAHPRTRKALEKIDAKFASHVQLIDPVGYYDIMALESNARVIATDSGGVQREAYFHAKPCITLRDETEWQETVDVGWNILVGAETDKIIEAWMNFLPPLTQPPIFGNGKAGEKIAETLDQIDISFN
jgi:UDP-N-acetylglucosamine 2-epimerase